MVKIYASLIKNGEDGYTIDKVPDRWKTDVITELNKTA